MPYPKKVFSLRQEPMTINVEYDRTQLAAEDIINVTAIVTNNRRGRAKMVIVDLGLPPGFTLIPDNLNRLVAETHRSYIGEDKVIEKYSATGRCGF